MPRSFAGSGNSRLPSSDLIPLDGGDVIIPPTVASASAHCQHRFRTHLRTRQQRFQDAMRARIPQTWFGCATATRIAHSQHFVTEPFRLSVLDTSCGYAACPLGLGLTDRETEREQ